MELPAELLARVLARVDDYVYVWEYRPDGSSAPLVENIGSFAFLGDEEDGRRGGQVQLLAEGDVQADRVLDVDPGQPGLVVDQCPGEVGPLLELVLEVVREEGADVVGGLEQVVDGLDADEDGRSLGRLGGAIGLVLGERGGGGERHGQDREAGQSGEHKTSWGDATDVGYTRAVRAGCQQGGSLYS